MNTVFFNNTSLNADYFAKAKREDALAELTEMAKANNEAEPAKWAADAFAAVTAKQAAPSAKPGEEVKK